MKVVAFLQNMWVRNPAKAQAMIARDTTGQLRERLISHSLFAGCLTGRRLRHTFGDLCDSIIWEEASPVIADNPKDYHPPDEKHIAAVLDKHRPDAVICFTRAAQDIISDICEARGIRFVPAVHPACRAKDVIARLCWAAQLLLNP